MLRCDGDMKENLFDVDSKCYFVSAKSFRYIRNEWQSRINTLVETNVSYSRWIVYHMDFGVFDKPNVVESIVHLLFQLPGPLQH